MTVKKLTATPFEKNCFASGLASVEQLERNLPFLLFVRFF
jgi:hypothetical protein